MPSPNHRHSRKSLSCPWVENVTICYQGWGSLCCIPCAWHFSTIISNDNANFCAISLIQCHFVQLIRKQLARSIFYIFQSSRFWHFGIQLQQETKLMNLHSTTMCMILLFCGELPKTLSCPDAGLDSHMPLYFGPVVGGEGLPPLNFFAVKSQSVGMPAILAIRTRRTSPYPPSALFPGSSTIFSFSGSHTTPPWRCCANADFSMFSRHGIPFFLTLENCRENNSTSFNFCNKSSCSELYLCLGIFLCTTSKVPLTTFVVFRVTNLSNHWICSA